MACEGKIKDQQVATIVWDGMMKLKEVSSSLLWPLQLITGDTNYSSQLLNYHSYLVLFLCEGLTGFL